MTVADQNPPSVRTGSPVLEARGVSCAFGQRTAVDDVSLALYPGTITALVGESGSGKTTLARLFALFYRPSAGEILLDGKPVSARGRKVDYYGQVQMIFQDPFSSLNSLKRIRHVLSRALAVHGKASGRRETDAKVVEFLERVSLTPGSQYLDKYPDELSGGQRQRISIARSLSVEPRVLLADEPTSMLDASIRVGILNLLRKQRDEEGLAVLYITHDIASARYLADEICVMKDGRIVERAPTEQLITDPQHPYTQQLLAAAPDPSRTAWASNPEGEVR
ncbi:MAG: ATP-binding cassette domain-containing protein [Nocardioidaceae bacterium]|nr:ATP-binding cassette domain-containing protein [Nocardioidaceae bacterium]MCL2613602.1 ATP-binding cassette domain-containing protein [Nocardioidaceae bacterium]